MGKRYQFTGYERLAMEVADAFTRWWHPPMGEHQVWAPLSMQSSNEERGVIRITFRYVSRQRRVIICLSRSEENVFGWQVFRVVGKTSDTMGTHEEVWEGERLLDFLMVTLGFSSIKIKGAHL